MANARGVAEVSEVPESKVEVFERFQNSLFGEDIPKSRQDSRGNWWISVCIIDPKDWARGGRCLVPFRFTYRPDFFEHFEPLPQ